MNARVLRNAALAGAATRRRLHLALRGRAHEGRRGHERRHRLARARRRRAARALPRISIVARDLLIADGDRKAVAHRARLDARCARAASATRAHAASGDVRSDAAPSLAHRSSRARVRRRREGESAAARRGRRTRSARRGARRHDRRRSRPITRRTRRDEKSGDFSARAVGFTGLEIARRRLRMPRCPTCRCCASSSCSRTNPRAFWAFPGGSLALGSSRRRDGFRRARLDGRSVTVCIEG